MPVFVVAGIMHPWKHPELSYSTVMIKLRIQSRLNASFTNF
jgi:hypothetical protein